MPFIGEMPPTSGDLHFSVLGIPVRVHPFFWLGALLLGLRGTEGDPHLMLSWIVAVFISILVHEMGHALTARYYGDHPSVTLHAFGGYATHQGAGNNPYRLIKITAAGPLAGFLLAGLVVAAVHASGGHVAFRSIPSMPIAWTLFVDDPDKAIWNFASDMLYINIYFGILNLLPIYPLDGGQITAVLCKLFGRGNAMETALKISLVTAVGMAVYALTRQQTYLTFLLGYLAYQNYLQLQAMSGGGFGRPRGGRW